MKKYNYNFSLITPGGCSASCDFCTDAFNEKFSKNYIQELMTVLVDVPEMFDQISVTGGEPTQSPLFKEIMMFLMMDKICTQRFKKRVLTTNGWKLGDFLYEVGNVFNHVNISRHAIGDSANQEIFKTDKIATDVEILSYCTELAKKGVDVNFNHVYNTVLDTQYIKDYIDYAKRLNVTKVTFRFDQNTNQMQMSETEKMIADEYVQVESGGCPVCREACYLIDGMYVTFKNSCAEPTKKLKGELYELIFHPDGKLYKDWSKTMPYDPEEKPVVKPKTIPIYTPSTSYGSGGCGRSGSGGCGS